MKGKSWDLPFNSARQSRISEGVNDALHSDIFFKEGLTEFAVMNILMRELSGTYKFADVTEDRLLDLENTFFWNLMFYGRVGIYEYKPKEYVIVNISSITYEYQKITKVWCAPAIIQFEQQSAQVDPQQKKWFVLSDMSKIVVISNDVTSEFFQLKFGWFIRGILNLNDMYWASTTMKLKKIAIWYNSKNKRVIDDLETSLKDNETFLKLTSPKIHNNIMKDASLALEAPFTIEKLDFPTDNYLGLEDLIKYYKWGKDLLGMNEKVNDMKERVVTTEVEDGKTNTELMAVSTMRNFEKFTRDMKSKFGINVNVVKSVDDLEEVKNSKQAFSQGVNNEEV